MQPVQTGGKTITAFEVGKQTASVKAVTTTDAAGNVAVTSVAVPVSGANSVASRAWASLAAAVAVAVGGAALLA